MNISKNTIHQKWWEMAKKELRRKSTAKYIREITREMKIN